jgi:hypothetical protein
MELTATSIDGFLAYWCGLNDVCGEIHSVFHRAMNIRTSGGQLISILSQVNGDGPNTVVAELPNGVDFISMGMRSGMPVRLGKKEALLGEGLVHLRMHRAHKWWPRLASGLECLNMDRLEGNLSILRDQLTDNDYSDGLGQLLLHLEDVANERWQKVRTACHGELIEKALPGLRSLVEGFLKQDADRLHQGLDGLVGLGMGLTPSGDDLLLGLTGTFSLVSKRVGGPVMDSILEDIRTYVAQIRGRTTFVSGNLLAYACSGRIASPILDVIRALLYEEAPAALVKAKMLLRQGESSGSEVLVGVLLALSLLPRLEER